MERAALLGLPALAIADENSVAGIVRAHTHAREIARQVRLRAEAEARGPIGPTLPSGWSPRRPFDDYPGSSQRAEPDPVARFETVAPRPAPSADIRTAPRLIPAARIVPRTASPPPRCPATAPPGAASAASSPPAASAPGRAPATCTSRTSSNGARGWSFSSTRHTGHGRGGAARAAGRHRRTRLARRFPGACHILLAPRYDGQDRPRFDRLARLAAPTSRSTPSPPPRPSCTTAAAAG